MEPGNARIVPRRLYGRRGAQVNYRPVYLFSGWDRMRRKQDQVRQRIVEAAYESLWRSGFTRTSVDGIAARGPDQANHLFVFSQQGRPACLGAAAL